MDISRVGHATKPSSAVNMNGTDAARRAGYKGNDRTLSAVSQQNLGKPVIREEINKRLKAATVGADVTVERVLRELQATYERATEERKYSVAVRCLELQGKYLKMFTDRIEHVDSIEELSMDQLMELLRELIGKCGLDVELLFGAGA